MKSHIINTRKINIGIIIFVSLLLFVKFIFVSQNLVLAQSPATATSISPTNVPTQTILEENNIDILVIKTQLEDLKEYNNNLLSTVQWSIGIVIATLIVILGINWFTTYSRYQKEITEYKKDLEKTISDETNRIQTNFSNTMNQRFDALIKKDEELIQSKFSTIIDEINYIRIAQSNSEANYWESRSVFENAVNCYIRMIDLDPNHATIQHTLSSLEKAITQCSRKMSPLTIQGVEDSMKKTIEHQKTLTEQVMTKLKENVAK